MSLPSAFTAEAAPMEVYWPFCLTPAAVQPPIVLVAVLGAAFSVLFTVFVSMVIRARRQVAGPIGTAALVGQLAIARTTLAPDGFVFIQGERWAARLDEGSTDEGGRVRVTGVNGFRLTVRKEDPS